jgi:hypothetical protein
MPLNSVADYKNHQHLPTDSPNEPQGFAIAATHLIAQQSSDDRPHTNSNRTILSNWCYGWVQRRC